MPDVLQYLKRAIEHAPTKALSPRAADLIGWHVGNHYICADCAGRIMDRGCQLPRPADPVWRGETAQPCCLCHKGTTTPSARMLTAIERQYRAVNYMPSGQRFDGWLPAGEYAIGGTCQIETARDSGEHATARMLTKGRETWYVSEYVYQATRPQGTDSE